MLSHKVTGFNLCDSRYNICSMVVKNWDKCALISTIWVACGGKYSV